jgi:hypothetical protein
MRLRLILCLLGAVAALQADALAQAPSVGAPGWLERPDAETFVQFYPPAALHQGVSGLVNLHCLVQLDTTAQCSVVNEAPSGWGFSEAALAISRSFRMSPATVGGRPVEGGRVNVPIRFRFAPPDNVPADLRQLLARLPPGDVIDIPTWEEAPNFETVRRVYPRAWEEDLHARVLLSCALNGERRLSDCTVERVAPADSEAGAAALALVRHFRVSAFESEFLAAHNGRRLVLPLSFGGGPNETPVDWFMDDLSVQALPPPPQEMLRSFYPPEARAAGLAGEAILRCAATDAGMQCSIFYEAPRNAGFGDAAQRFIASLPGPSPQLLPGEVFVPFLFKPD